MNIKCLRSLMLLLILLSIVVIVPSASGQHCVDYHGHIHWLWSHDIVWAKGVAILDDIVFVGGYYGLHVFDITPPVVPDHIAHPIDNVQMSTHSVIDQYLIVGGNNCLGVYDISSPTLPVFVDTVQFLGEVSDISILGNHVYLACSYGDVRIVNIADPESPYLVGSLETTDWL